MTLTPLLGINKDILTNKLTIVGTDTRQIHIDKQTIGNLNYNITRVGNIEYRYRC